MRPGQRAAAACRCIATATVFTDGWRVRAAGAETALVRCSCPDGGSLVEWMTARSQRSLSWPAGAPLACATWTFGYTRTGAPTAIERPSMPVLARTATTARVSGAGPPTITVVGMARSTLFPRRKLRLRVLEARSGNVGIADRSGDLQQRQFATFGELNGRVLCARHARVTDVAGLDGDSDALVLFDGDLLRCWV